MLAIAAGVTTIAAGFTAGQFIHTLYHELHNTLVAEETFHHFYKGGSFIVYLAQKQYQKRQDEQNPDQQVERNAETLYNFEATGNAAKAILDIKKEAEKYLANLNNRVADLEKALKYFTKVNTTLTNLMSVLTSNDYRQLPTYLIEINSYFQIFENNFNLFFDSIVLPPRQTLYIADLLREEKPKATSLITRYNNRLKSIKGCFEQLKKIEQAIAIQLYQGFNAARRLRPNEPLRQVIQLCIDDPNQISKRMHALLPNNQALATSCTDTLKLFITLKQAYKTKLTNPLEANPNWFPLLTTAQQIKAGRRIFLHAMNNNKTRLSEENKLLIAKIFCRELDSKYEMKQNDIDMQAYEMAGVLLKWQIQKCEKLTRFLSKLEEGKPLPDKDPDGLLKWLGTEKIEQTPVELFTKILVSPCCFNQSGTKSASDNLERLSLAELGNLIKKHLGSHGGAIWKKNDTLIQLPKSFKTSISEKDRMEQDEPSQNPNVVSPVMQKLAKALIEDLQRLKTELQKNTTPYLTQKSIFSKKIDEFYKVQKDQQHKAGVTRIKKAESDIRNITSSTSKLLPYLYQTETINAGGKKKRKVPIVPTKDDLLHVIYIGVNPNGGFNRKGHSETSSPSKQLAHYFYPKQTGDSKTSAWFYAYTTCQVDKVTALAHLFSGSLALANMPESLEAIKNELAVQTIFEDPKKVLIANSKALNGVAPKTAKETQVLFQELLHYFGLALVRVKPEYRKKLPFAKRWKFTLRNSIKFNHKIERLGQKRLESSQKYIGYLCAVFSGKNIAAINNALEDLNKNYNEIYEKAERTDRSDLHTIMKKIQEGPVLEIINQVEKALSMTQKIEEIVKRKETEEEQKEKEAAQANATRLRAELAKAKRKPQTQPQPAIERSCTTLFKAKIKRNSQARPQPTVSRSCTTLFKAKAKSKRKPQQPQLAASQASNTVVDNLILPGCSHHGS
ncbi:hypothetical protein [Rickettsiella endosymbiont of Dermanyssus gallinae]|uniref:hypothetical protein n=1 Tax=Rickettsiella endosymbiont of Dermanyssus gallinae TaxID=2856608 RepID=UPI001C5323E0|nr:hypothetical protein [Rickettsiella endosymbiont of Dermanyssus gallinae]